MGPMRTDLSNANLAGAMLAGADFTEADLSGTIFRDVKGYAEAKGLDRAANADKIVL